jgi:hypothetical protein
MSFPFRAGTTRRSHSYLEGDVLIKPACAVPAPASFRHAIGGKSFYRLVATAASASARV